jgi:1-acyl-sn-glycerol-3-phosphate acyltransferase
MNFDKIEKYSFLYEIGRVHATFGHNSLFYKQVHVTGLENIPENCAVILACNHQNALMDAMAIICTRRWQPVFLARSDIFGNPYIAKLLLGMKILPVYRLRDGKESLKKNEEIFKINVEILKNKKYLGIFPEASHLGIRKLRTINKGISRIAFQAEEEADFKLNLKILPVGLVYSNYYSFRSIIQINYGKPISISDLEQEYKENPNNAHFEVRRRIEEGIKPLIINIENDKFYDMYENLREIYDNRMMKRMNFRQKTFPEKFISDKKMIAALDAFDEENLSEMEKLNEKVVVYQNGLNKFKLRDWLFEKPKSGINLFLQFIFMILTLPLFIYGTINNILPFKLPKLITKKMKDKNFHTSVEYGIWLFFYPVYYFVLFLIMWTLTDIVWIKWVFLLSLPFSAFFAFWFWKLGLKFFAKLRYYLAYNSNEIKNLQKIRAEIISMVDEMVDKFEKKNNLE